MNRPEVTVVFVCSVVFCQLLIAQENGAARPPKNAVDRIADKASLSLVLANKAQLLKNVGQLLRDVGKESAIPFLGFPHASLASRGISDEQALVLNDFENRFNSGALLVDLKDRAKFIETLNVTAAQLDSGKPFQLEKEPNFIFSNFLWVAGQGDSVVLGKSAEHVQAVLDRDLDFPNTLAAKSREILNRCDIGLTVDIQKANDKDANAKWTSDLKIEVSKEDEPTVELLGQAMTFARRLATAARYENHELRWETELTFAKNGAISQLLRTRKDPSFSGTAGLPREDLILSFGFDSNHFKTESAARVFARASFVGNQNWSMLPGFSRELYSRLFGSFWRHVEASRLGLYSSSNPDHAGQLCLLGVVDARDPDALLQEFQDLVHVARVAEETDEDARELIERLIAQLGDTKFKVREAASLRLALLGKKAIKHLEAAKESKDFEISYRAKRLLRSYHGASKVNVEKVVGDKSFWMNLKPQFQFEETTEKCLEFPCIVVRMRLPEEQQKVMSSVFGDQSHRIRMVRIERQFVVMVGSDTKRLERTVQNVVDGKDPVAGVEQVASRKLGGSQLQIHLSVARLNNLLFHKEPESLIEHPGGDLTSLGISFEEHHWGLDLFMPGSELKVIVDNPRMSLLR